MTSLTLAVLLAAGGSGSAAAQGGSGPRSELVAIPPRAADGVVDAAHMLTDEEHAKLATRIAAQVALDQTEVTVLTLSQAGNETLTAIAIRAISEWNLPRRSALLLITVDPKSFVIQVGPDLTETLNPGVGACQ